MKNMKMNALSDEELRKKQKLLKVTTYILGGTLFFLLCLRIITIIMEGFKATSIIPIVLLPILIINFKKLNEIKEELKSRNSG